MGTYLGDPRSNLEAERRPAKISGTPATAETLYPAHTSGVPHL
jgi:hypothetical protein